MYMTFALFVFMHVFLATNRMSGDSHKPYEKTDQTFDAPLQRGQILLWCFSLKSPEVEPLNVGLNISLR